MMSTQATESAQADAEKALCRSYADRIRGYGLRHLRDAAAAEDLVRHVLLAVLQADAPPGIRTRDRAIIPMIESQGRADIDALAAWLGDREWFVSDVATQADASAFGLLAVTIRSNLPRPVCCYARTKPNLAAFVDRVLARWFGDTAGTCLPPQICPPQTAIT